MSKQSEEEWTKELIAHLRAGKPLAEMIISPPIQARVTEDGGILVYGLAAAGPNSLGLPLLFRFPSEGAKILLATLQRGENDPDTPKPESGTPHAH